MSDSLKHFIDMIAPFRRLWRGMRVTTAAVLHKDRWMALRTRVVLSDEDPVGNIFVMPTDYFMAISRPLELSAFEPFINELEQNGKFEITSEDQSVPIYLTFGNAGGEGTASPIHFWDPRPSGNEERESELALGASLIRLQVASGEEHYSFFTSAQCQEVSSRLRSRTPRYGGIRELFLNLGLPYDLDQCNTAVTDIVALLPFAMRFSDAEVFVTAPVAAASEMRVVSSFGKIAAELELKAFNVGETKAKHVEFRGALQWPPKASKSKTFLYFGDREIGCVNVRRWSGTPNWKLKVDRFFDHGWDVLRKQLVARKEPRTFELAVTRILNLLGVPTVWYGDSPIQDRGDTASIIELDGEWIVVLGECTGQKPSVKYTPLLTRKRELEEELEGEVRIIPVVFTPSTVSLADKRQAAEDGIVVLGADEISELVSGIESAWGPKQLINFLRQNRSSENLFITGTPTHFGSSSE